MKKVLPVLSLILLVACLLTACGYFKPHAPDFGEWEITKEPTCTEEGERVRYCSCGDKQSEVIPAKGHSEVITEATAPTCTEAGRTEGKKCSACGEVLANGEVIPAMGHTEVSVPGIQPTCTEVGRTEGKKCSACGEVLVISEEIPAKGHSYNEGKCTVCGESNQSYGSEGLEYTLSEDGKSYSVSKGTCADSDIIIPSIYNGLPVTCIGEGAFAFCSSITSIVIPDSVTSIGEMALVGCSSLRSIVIGDGVTSIGVLAFGSCSSLTNISVSANNTNYMDIDGNLYSKDGKILVQYAVGKTETTFVIPDGVTSIGEMALVSCSSLTSIVITDSVTSIGEGAFAFCSSITSIVIPDSVTSIGEGAFYGCSSLTDVYYKGSEEMWKIISIDSSNDNLTKANIHYNYVSEN